MKKLFVLLSILFFASYGKLSSQEVKPLASIIDIEQIKESAKGKVLLINFWATWCKPCIHEFPALVKLYNDYKAKDFEIVFISVDVPEDINSKVIPFLKDQKVDFITYYDNFDRPEELIDYIDKNWEGAIPSTYIYDKEGNLTKHILGSTSYDEFEQEIKKNLD